jgi:Zn-dependent peptidase ImmA (M78 family)
MRSYDARQEDEANWLAWAILLPRAALLDAKRSGMAVPQIAEQFGVSEVLVRFRMRICGVNAQIRAAQSYAKRKPTVRRP